MALGLAQERLQKGQARGVGWECQHQIEESHQHYVIPGFITRDGNARPNGGWGSVEGDDSLNDGDRGFHKRSKAFGFDLGMTAMLSEEVAIQRKELPLTRPRAVRR